MASAAVPSMAGPPDRTQTSPGPANLAGETTPSPMPDQNKQNEAFVSQIRQWTKEFDDFARQFPAFSDSARKMKDAAIEGMTKTLAQSRRAQQQAPPIAA